jgi:TetR/AcrR family transcriptional regulator
MNERSPHGAAKSVRHGQRHRKTRAQQQRALATRAAILNAAIAEFAERGFESAPRRQHGVRLGHAALRS